MRITAAGKIIYNELKCKDLGVDFAALQKQLDAGKGTEYDKFMANVGKKNTYNVKDDKGKDTGAVI